MFINLLKRFLKNDFLFFRSLYGRARYVDFTNKRKFRYLRLFSNIFIFIIKILLSKIIVFLAKKNTSKKNNNILIVDYVPNINRVYNFENKLNPYHILIYYSKSLNLKSKRKRELKLYLIRILLNNIEFDSLIFDCKALIIFEGDRSQDMIRGYLAKALNKKVILIERSSYISNKINPLQSNYQITDYLSFSKSIVQRIKCYSPSDIKWHLIKNHQIRIDHKDISKNKKKDIYFVGQPNLHKPKDYLCKMVQPLSENSYKKTISKIFNEIIISNNYNLFYIKHPYEEKPNFLDEKIKVITHENLTINYRDIIIGFYSSLLYQYLSNGIRIILLGDNYKKLIFHKLKNSNDLIKNYPITNNKTLFLPLIDSFKDNLKINTFSAKDFISKIKEIL